MEQRTYPSDGTTHADRIPWHLAVSWLRIASVVTLVVLAIAVVFLSLSRREASTAREPLPAVRVASRVPIPESAAVVIASVDYPDVANVWGRRTSRPTDLVLADIGSEPTATGVAFAHKLLPQLRDLNMILVAIARDPADPNVVFATIGAVDDRSTREESIRASRENREPKFTDEKFVWSFYLLLSVDGEKSWHELTLLPTTHAPVSAATVGVKADGDIIRAAARDTKLSESESWWETTIKRSELPAL